MYKCKIMYKSVVHIGAIIETCSLGVSTCGDDLEVLSYNMDSMKKDIQARLIPVNLQNIRFTLQESIGPLTFKAHL